MRGLSETDLYPSGARSQARPGAARTLYRARPEVGGEAQDSGRGPVCAVCGYAWYVVGWGTH